MYIRNGFATALYHNHVLGILFNSSIFKIVIKIISIKNPFLLYMANFQILKNLKGMPNPPTALCNLSILLQIFFLHTSLPTFPWASLVWQNYQAVNCLRHSLLNTFHCAYLLIWRFQTNLPRQCRTQGLSLSLTRASISSSAA